MSKRCLRNKLQLLTHIGSLYNCSSPQDLYKMTLHTHKNYICTCVSFINIFTELPKPSTTTLAYMEDYDEKTHIKGKMRSCKMITQENGEGQNLPRFSCIMKLF